MPLRDLVVVLDGTSRDEGVLNLALGVARQHGAHVTGLCPLEMLYPFDLGSAVSGYPQLLVLRDVAGHLEAKAREQASAVQAVFETKLAAAGVSGEWQAVDGAAVEAITFRARTTDLVVLGQPVPGQPLPVPAGPMIEDALLRSGRPLLVVPFAGTFESVGRNVLVGWNGTREAARAIHDALMLVEPGGTVTVLTVEKAGRVDEEAEKPASAMAEHLARHGVNAVAARTISDRSISDGDALLNYASDLGADMLVMGGYGHSRVREIILGGVSNALLDHTTLPLLMSH